MKFEIKNLKVKRGDSVLIEDANLSFNSGEVVLLEGLNGAGKSSLLNAIFKNPEYEIVEGQILIDGNDVTNMKTHEIARSGLYLGMQHVPEIEGVSTIKMLYKSYVFMCESRKKEILSISEFKKDLDSKCEEFNIDKKLLERDLNVGFSGGEKKLADLIHILALDPVMVFLDEPDSGVDKEAVLRVYDFINKQKNKDKGFFITSHSEKVEVVNIDKIYKLENKQIVQVR
jgi:Fe-S cluster assembly ATP-binding protein